MPTWNKLLRISEKQDTATRGILYKKVQVKTIEISLKFENIIFIQPLEMEASVRVAIRVAVSQAGEEESATDPCVDRDVRMEGSV